MARIIAVEQDVEFLEWEGRQADRAFDPMRSALGQPSDVLVIRPGGALEDDRDDILVLTVRHSQARQAEELLGGRKVIGYAATGLLGLGDEPIYEVEPRRWGRRLRFPRKES